MSTSTSKTWQKQGQTQKAKAERLRQAAWRGWAPPARISVPTWADEYRRLAKEAGNLSGRWHTDTVEVARGPMLAVTEPGVHVITTMCCTQLMKTALIENIFGFFAHLDPAPMLLVQPKEDAAQAFSKERIDKMVKATPALSGLVGTGKSRSSDDTLLYKAFPGGFLSLVGAGSPDNLARRPVRITLFDEVDKYPVTKEGDPIALGEERTATFGANWLSVRACSPTVEDESRIARSYAASDQRRASVACPHCGHRQFLDFFKHVEWEKDESGNHQPKTARIYCESCGCEWSEGDRLHALQTTRWHQTRPFECCGRRHSPLDDYARAWRDGAADPVGAVWAWWEGDRWAVHRARCPDCGAWTVDNEHAGFQASKLYSPWSKDRPQDIAKKWLDAQGDDDAKQTWWNTQLGLPYRPRVGRDIKPHALMERREVWPGEVPAGVALLTSGVDTQPDRLEVETVGWGRSEESWSVEFHVIEGDPNQPEVWQRLDEYLLRPRLRADGRPFTIAACCIDTGGWNTQAVYNFCRGKLPRRIWAIKGASETSGQRAPVWPTARTSKKRSKDYRPVIIGTNAAKDRISDCLAIETPGPGYMHFPAERDAGYFTQLTSERLALRKRNGRTYRIWEPKKGMAHEALDCRVYAYAALWGLIVTDRKDLDREALKVGAIDDVQVVRIGTPEAQRLEAEKEPVIEAKPVEKPKRKPRRVARSNWMG
ncbi:phage terminase large subunit family protein [Roseospira visakhapatnamensis]|uniref:Phage terminase large subunit GpA-like protein n=1 Tax=Roseospira visakhapatnamensis TaxID=390880 RepID=A0A7W6RGT1_9PROT|nr:terminase gpA endonuclease subunit [Roseospira visakhapatnamensis]MBB4267721.1 phage terminase large subunit GpA-like protein [Roseospira visakhapatnamensis]